MLWVRAFIIEKMETVAIIAGGLVVAAWAGVEIFFPHRMPSPGVSVELLLIAILLPIAAIVLFVA